VGSLDGKVTLITGGAGAIGLATARRCSEEGATVIIADLDGTRVERAADDLRARGTDVRALQVDVTSDGSVAAMVADVASVNGRVDVLFTSAGFLSAGSVTDASLDDWHRTLAVNVTGTFLCARHVVPVMVAGGGGSIVVMSSTAGLVAEPDIAAYCASKGAVLMLGRQMAIDYARQGIRVNVICPGWIDTPFNDPVIARSGPEAVSPPIDTIIPLGRQGHPDEVADVVVFLASDASRLMTGSVVVADGGLTAQ
jgi:meso-butanediol dehydrogenase / (S,S)-butanediol dehydrogenase / diacetyl reductase